MTSHPLLYSPMLITCQGCWRAGSGRRNSVDDGRVGCEQAVGEPDAADDLPGVLDRV